MSPVLNSMAGASARGYGHNRGNGIRSIGKVGQNNTTTSSTTATLPFSANVPIGATVIFYVRSGSGTSNLPNATQTDMRGNTYTRDAYSSNPTGTNCSIFSSNITTAIVSGDIMTINFGGAIANKTVGAFAFDGILRSNLRVDYGGSTSNNSGYSNTSALFSAGITWPGPEAYPSELIFMAVATAASQAGNYLFVYANNPLNLLANNANTSLSTAFAGGGYYIQTVGGNTPVAWIAAWFAGTSTTYGTCAVSYIPQP